MFFEVVGYLVVVVVVVVVVVYYAFDEYCDCYFLGPSCCCDQLAYRARMMNDWLVRLNSEIIFEKINDLIIIIIGTYLDEQKF